jgi:hypothetical protein
VAVGDRTLELGGGLLVPESRSLQIVLTHRSGSSSGHGISASSAKRA